MEDTDFETEEPPIVFSATIEATRDAALFVYNHDANETHWVPRSCVTGGFTMDEDDDYDDFELAYWKAEELGWV